MSSVSAGEDLEGACRFDADMKHSAWVKTANTSLSSERGQWTLQGQEHFTGLIQSLKANKQS